VITPTPGGGGFITPSAPQTVNYGGSVTFTIMPDTGYVVNNVVVNDVSQGPIMTYTFPNVTADGFIVATFKLQDFMITPSREPGAGGTITPSAPQTVPYGGSVTFTITPSTGYVVNDVVVNGVSQGSITTYTFANVTANGSIVAKFKPMTFVITPTPNPGGAITPGTPQTVNYGAGATFTITPNTGYVINDVRMDGVSNPGAVAAGSYTFTNVTANHTIEATFKKQAYRLFLPAVMK